MMIKIFRKIRQKLLCEGLPVALLLVPSKRKAGKAGKTSQYLKYAIGEILLVVLIKTNSCPVRDKLWVETNKDEFKHRAFRYEIYNVPKGTFNQHQTYLLPR